MIGPNGAGEVKMLHRVTGNQGRIRLWPLASREHLVPPIGAQLEEKEAEGGERMKSHQSFISENGA